MVILYCKIIKMERLRRHVSKHDKKVEKVEIFTEETRNLEWSWKLFLNKAGKSVPQNKNTLKELLKVT